MSLTIMNIALRLCNTGTMIEDVQHEYVLTLAHNS